jgi:hypothetical protein
MVHSNSFKNRLDMSTIVKLNEILVMVYKRGFNYGEFEY